MREFGAADRELLDTVLRSGRLSRSPDGMVRRLGREFAARVGAQFGIPRNANLTALSQCLALAGVGSGDAVICDPLVQYGGIAALSVGAEPVFVDVRPDTYNFDERQLEETITARTKAVIVTHLWGLCAGMDTITEICSRHDLFLIEDCAHAIGSTWDGRHAGTFGDVGVFSLHQNKQLSTGDGGVIVTDHQWIHDLLYNEWPSGESPEFLTLNYHMNELTAAVGVAQLPRVDVYLAEYARSHAALDTALGDAGWLQPRSFPEQAEASPYWWAALWSGDRQGPDFGEFKRRIETLDTDLGCNFTERPAPQWPVFINSGTCQSHELPVACDVLDRVIHVPVIELSYNDAVSLGQAMRSIGDSLTR